MPIPIPYLHDIYRAADQYQLPPQVLVNLVKAESSFNPRARSPAGAIGLTQLMPDTARALGIDNPWDPIANLAGGAHYLREQLDRFHTLPLALAAYNAGPGAVERYGGIPPYRETQDYVQRILGSLDQPVPQRPSAPAYEPAPAQAEPIQPTGQPQAFSRALLAILNQSLSSLSLPGIPAALLQGFSQPQRASAQPQRASEAPQAPRRSLPAPTVPSRPTRAYGQVTLGPNADRPGVRTSGAVLDFVSRISHVLGQPLTIGTGTSHHQFSRPGRVSQHWSGHAADIPASGAELTRLGQAALIAAGMPSEEARRQHGGLFNLNGHQIIFNVDLGPSGGGNHYDHLHVSA